MKVTNQIQKLLVVIFLVAAMTQTDAAIKRMALIKDGVVMNIILVDDNANWAPPDGYITVPAGRANIGYTYDGQKFAPKVLSEAEIAEAAARKDARKEAELNRPGMKAFIEFWAEETGQLVSAVKTKIKNKMQ